MQKINDNAKSLLSSTKPPWKDRKAYIESMVKYVDETQDPKMVGFLQKNYKYIAIQFQDLR